MKRCPVFLLLAVTFTLCLPSAFAASQNTVLVPLPSLDDFTRGQDGWAFGIGAGVEYETAYEGSDEFSVEAQPAGAIQWRNGNDIFYFAGEALGWRKRYDHHWLLDGALAFDEGREEGDSDDGYLAGLGDQDEEFALVLQVRRAFSADWRYWLVGRIVTGDSGNLGLFGVGRRFGQQSDGAGHEINLVAVFHDSEYANRGFGINEEQSNTSGLPVTTLSGGLRSFGIDYNFRYYLNENWQIYSEALFEYYSSDIRHSLIARSNYEAEVGLGVIYVF